MTPCRAVVCPSAATLIFDTFLLFLLQNINGTRDIFMNKTNEFSGLCQLVNGTNRYQFARCCAAASLRRELFVAVVVVISLVISLTNCEHIFGIFNHQNGRRGISV